MTIDLSFIEEDKAKQYLVIKFNRPHEKNAFSLELAQQFKGIIEAIKTKQELSSGINTQNIKGLIITGEQDFSAGGNLEWLKEKITKSPKDNRSDMIDFYYSFLGMLELPLPIASCITGYAYGAGLLVALAADITLFAKDCKIAANFLNLGLYPGMGSTVFLRKLLGNKRAHELLLTGAQVNGQEELINWGFTAKCYDKETIITDAYKRLSGLTYSESLVDFLYSSRINPKKLGKALEKEAKYQGLSYQSDVFADKITTFLSKKKN